MPIDDGINIWDMNGKPLQPEKMSFAVNNLKMFSYESSSGTLKLNRSLLGGLDELVSSINQNSEKGVTVIFPIPLEGRSVNLIGVRRAEYFSEEDMYVTGERSLPILQIPKRNLIQRIKDRFYRLTDW